MESLPHFPGPLAIDGFVQRQGAAGDWLPGPGGATNIVFTNNCTPLVPFAYHLTDLFNDQVNDDIFDGGNKLFQNPNDWGWRSQKPPAKDDINNSLVFLALNPVDNHLWIAITGDRMSTNGTSYLDFEFYQNPITKTGGPIPGGTGGFPSTGPHNGRTVGDISITLQYTAGGSFASVFYLQWQPGAEAGQYDYFEINPPAGTAFAAANGGAAPINFPCGAFGGTQYETLQFVEGAIDLTALIGGTGFPGPCGVFPFKTLFIKSKSSAETTADLKDFISPFQINACFDNTAPVIKCPPTLNLQGCNPTIPPPTGATASDNCNGPVIPVASDGPITSTSCGRSMTRTWMATDDCGNSASCTQQINWNADNTPPIITTGGPSTTLGCNPSASDVNGALGTATATDACGTPTLSSSTGNIISNGCGSLSQTRTWTAIDACGNTSTAARTVTWVSDHTPPIIITGGTTTTLGCNPSAGDINGALGTATATDACVTPTEFGEGPLPGACVSSYKGNNGGGNCPDLNGHPATGKVTLFFTSALSAAPTILSVTDNDPATDLSNVLFGPGVLANDGLSAEYCVYEGPNNNNNLWGGNIVLTFTLQLANGQGCVGPVVQRRVPRTLDSQTIALQTTVTLTSSDGPVTSNGCNRSQTRTWTASDDCGNTSTASRTVTWISDVTPPVLTTGGTSTSLGCNPSASDINAALGTATATDACGVPTVSSSDGTVTSNGCNRSQTRTWTARDGCGNTATASRTVTWISDVTPPVLTTGGTSTSLGCNPSASDINAALGTATATDACGVPTVSSSDGTVTSNGCNRSQTRTWTARDACGNTSTASRTVTWISDVTPPVLTTGGTSTSLGCNPSASDINAALGTATATDACGVPTVSSSDGTVTSNGCNRSQTRTWTARDACGNTSTASRTVTWISDVTPPVLTTGGTSTSLGCNPSASDINAALGTATATDACGVPTVSSSDGTVTSNGCNRSQTRTWTARDACGNTSTASRTVTWTSDVTPPVLTTGGTSTSLGCNPSASDINAALGTATATDACGVPTVSSSDGTVTSNGCNRSQTRTWTAIDGCGNTATASRTVTWISDVTPPVLTTGGTSTSLGCNPSASDINAALGTATATDACGVPTVSSSDGTVTSNGCNRSQTRTWTAIDGCGNTATASRTVTWIS